MTSYRSQINNNLVEPTVIRGLPNGDYPARALADVHNHQGEVIGQLCPPAARAWDALVADAWADGVSLTATSSADTFRPLAIQKRIFTDRYRTTNQGNGSRVCAGKTWFKRQGVATAACPGTSNHGRGLAVDIANCSGARLAWLEANAARFGFQWELASEPWHIHYMPGDVIPQAVLDHEVRTTQSEEDDDMPKVMTPAAPNQDAGKAFVVGDAIRTWILSQEDLAQAVALHGPIVTVSSAYWEALVRPRTATDVNGLRSLPPAQAELLTETHDAVVKK